MGAARTVRRPAVAGLFYVGDKLGLRAQIKQCFLHSLGPGSLPAPVPGAVSIKGLLSPHAGYLYSGPVAAHAYHLLGSSLLANSLPQLAVVIGPNHHGIGAPVAISSDHAWWTPFGEVSIDREASEAVASLCSYATLDSLAHRHEHSVEVQVPFLQYLYGESFSLVAISTTSQEWEVSRAIGEAISQVAAERSVVIIASSDMTHYESRGAAIEKDKMAMDAMLSLDPKRFRDVVRRHSLSVCGPGPVMAMMHACRCMGATKAELLKHATSGDVSGDHGRVVGYASAAVS